MLLVVFWRDGVLGTNCPKKLLGTADTSPQTSPCCPPLPLMLCNSSPSPRPLYTSKSLRSQQTSLIRPCCNKQTPITNHLDRTGGGDGKHKQTLPTPSCNTRHKQALNLCGPRESTEMTAYMHFGADVDLECGQRSYQEESQRPGCKLSILINTGVGSGSETPFISHEVWRYPTPPSTTALSPPETRTQLDSRVPDDDVSLHLAMIGWRRGASSVNATRNPDLCYRES
ncbi:uncharacterized protein [Symphalangus syndactylus]|uniref:uncharacterized protein n=1 Tax=Symphalangus syndactylus TaxID=9590 RepID=UPI0030078D93